MKGWAPAMVLAAALAVTGCGSSSLSAIQLRTRARHACAIAQRRLNAIPTPTLPAGGQAFLRNGIAALEPELSALGRLHASGELATQFTRARTATGQEVDALRSTLKGLKAGNDPVVAIKTLEQELIGLERHAGIAWRAVGASACAST